MIWGLVQIFVFQSIGELISKFILPMLPGPVVGLVLLLAWLIIKKEINSSLAHVADGLAQYLGVLFVPAAVGVVLYLPELKSNAWAIIVALVVSVIATIMASSLVLKLFSSRLNSGESHHG